MMFQVVEFFTGLADLGAAFLLLLGIIWIIYGLYEATRRKSFLKKKAEDWDFPITKFLKVLTLCGFVVGILCVIVGIGSIILDLPPSKLYGIEHPGVGRNLFTSIFLIILGLITFLKPINDLPIASMLGLIIATIVCIILAWIIPDGAVKFLANYVNPKIVLIIIFIIIFAIVAITVKFWMSFWMGLSKLLSYPPLAFILAAFCIIQATLLIVVGNSLF